MTRHLMQSISPIRKIYLVGICGTAMASLAGMLRAVGYQVSGADAGVYPPMSTFLAGLGIPVHSGYDEAHIREAGPDLVVIGNALSRGNPEIEYVLDRGLRYASLPETLKEFFIRGRRATVVCGTHGKTTTTAMLAWMLQSAGRHPSFMVGGIAENFGSSFQVGTGSDFIIEGDEYDTAFFDKGPKFLHYLPSIALVKNIEFDHADIYPDLESIQLAFRRLIRIVPRSGLIVGGTDSPAVGEVLDPVWSELTSFGLDSGDWRADGIAAAPDGGTRFDVVRGGKLWGQLTLPMVGRFNVLNALSAVVAADRIGLSKEEIATGLGSFRNVRRRLEVRGEVNGIVVYDDFAHHPTAIRETLAGVRERFPEARIWAVFEPRSQTARRVVFEDRFAEALAIADIAVIAPVFGAARPGSGPLLSPERVRRAISGQGRQAYAPESTDAILNLILGSARPGDRVVIMSNGGFDRLHERLVEGLRERLPADSG